MGNLACHIALVDVNGDIGLDIVGIVISTGFHALAQGNKDGLAIVPKALDTFSSSISLTCSGSSD